MSAVRGMSAVPGTFVVPIGSDELNHPSIHPSIALHFKFTVHVRMVRIYAPVHIVRTPLPPFSSFKKKGKILYKYVHSLHHKSYNPSTWAGLSMHPVEGAIYFTAAMIPAAFGAHPYTFILCKLCLAIDSWVAHDGFGPPSAGVYFHYLHHVRMLQSFL